LHADANVQVSARGTQQLKLTAVVDQFEPKGLITVSYGKDKEVALGNTLKPSETQEAPQINLAFSESEPEASYTLVVTDPDAPTKGDKKWSEYAHFILSGIKAKPSEGEVTHVDYNAATTLLPYTGPAPPPKTGKHRYVFILYKEGSQAPKGLPSQNRANWGTGIPGSGARDWARKQALLPVAINFFYAQNPDQGNH
jgi:phosphatidylethanolamine-binding protein (PEBP) family uncharacterized protein